MASFGGKDRLSVHLKIDTGMHRVGCDPADALALAARIDASAELDLAGVCTHLAVADEPDNPYTGSQLAQFDAALGALRAAGHDPGIVHAANSAAALALSRRASRPRPHRHRCLRPAARTVGRRDRIALRPALSLHARVMMVRELAAGERVSYGLRYELERPGRIATVSAGYADGVPRNLGLAGGEVLVRGRRHPIVGIVTMDQLMVDVGDELVEAGDEVVLIGRQGDAEITATEWADVLDTISYEIVTGIGARVPRTYTE